MQEKERISSILSERKLICDGAFGTYYASRYATQELPEKSNLLHPERVLQIHEEYIQAGADIIRTNTYACNTSNLESMEQVEACIKAGYDLAKQAAHHAMRNGREEVLVAADIGPIPARRSEDRQAIKQEYLKICEIFKEQGAGLFIFETFSDLEDILPAISAVGKDSFVLVQFAMSQFGYSGSGLSGRKLFAEAGKNEWIDAVGFNCGVGPGHMNRILKQIDNTFNKFISALPNAGYPHQASSRMTFSDRNILYFQEKVCEIGQEKADIVGGCCGTTPEYIKSLADKMDRTPRPFRQDGEQESTVCMEKTSHAFFRGKEGKKLIAVELAPPLGSDDEKMMDAAHLLIESGVDVLTFPDSPSGRTRADSILMAEKVYHETKIPVMPHICCRDKNAIAMRSQLLGAQINGIYNFLVITGDPIPSVERSQVRSVFNFDSVGLMQMMSDMNEEQFQRNPITYGGAINQGRRNLEVEIGRVKRKMEMGAEFFLTQPVSTGDSAERLRRVKMETGARILCGIMPFVSLKNALFMKNEMSGIDVDDEVLARFHENMTKEEGEQAGVQLARDMIALTKDFADGYYFSFPFNRVYLLREILKDSLI
ncbi:MAG: bifunctional homocysteine S-methyltransferase/methylenetetrahydrofolate reductase [Acetatifactor sp.]|nr:bifunctional homocysteine S-methyltransferase/methylenetetrahydrofolate reductase [Acetatifactor sp.]